MGPALGIFFGGKSSQNSPKPVLIFWRCIPCVFCMYITLLKVVGYYDLSGLSMSVMGFQKKHLDGGWVGGVSSIQFCLDVLNFLNFAKPLTLCVASWLNGRMPDSQSREPGFESPLLLFRGLGIFTQLYKWVPGYRSQLWKCEWIVVARNCCMARMLHREVELVSEWTGLPGGEV